MTRAETIYNEHILESLRKDLTDDDLEEYIYFFHSKQSEISGILTSKKSIRKQMKGLIHFWQNHYDEIDNLSKIYGSNQTLFNDILGVMSNYVDIMSKQELEQYRSYMFQMTDMYSEYCLKKSSKSKSMWNLYF